MTFLLLYHTLASAANAAHISLSFLSLCFPINFLHHFFLYVFQSTFFIISSSMFPIQLYSPFLPLCFPLNFLHNFFLFVSHSTFFIISSSMFPIQLSSPFHPVCFPFNFLHHLILYSSHSNFFTISSSIFPIQLSSLFLPLCFPFNFLLQFFSLPLYQCPITELFIICSVFCRRGEGGISRLLTKILKSVSPFMIYASCIPWSKGIEIQLARYKQKTIRVIQR